MTHRLPDLNMSVEIVLAEKAAEKGQAPFPVELIVFEEDTSLVLSAGNFMRDIRQETSELVQEMSHFEPLVRGTVVRKGQRLYAIVHDLDQEPACDKQSVRQALDEIMRICIETKVRSIAIEPLGCVHGHLDRDWFLQQLEESAAASSLQRIWVSLPPAV